MAAGSSTGTATPKAPAKPARRTGGRRTPTVAKTASVRHAADLVESEPSAGAYARLSEVSAAARAAAAADPEPTLREVVLAFDKLPGRRVQVAGDFNDWIPDRDVLTEKARRGVRKVLKLRPGAYQYRVIVDGIWQEDPGNPERVPNIYGGENSLLHVEAEPPAPSA
jgi:hypothetical protein